MDFLRRGSDQPQTVRSSAGQHLAPSAMAAEAPARPKHASADSLGPKWVRVASVVLLFSLAVLALSIAGLFYFSRDREAHLVDASKVQAVFLTNGQVYFGKVKEINHQFVNLQDIYYLNSQSSSNSDNKDQNSTPTNFSLVKLGCELHSPLDQMVINRDQVSFWENLNSDGKVAKGIAQWKSENPDGLKCSETTNNTQQSATNNNATSTDNKQ